MLEKKVFWYNKTVPHRKSCTTLARQRMVTINTRNAVWWEHTVVNSSGVERGGSLHEKLCMISFLTQLLYNIYNQKMYVRLLRNSTFQVRGSLFTWSPSVIWTEWWCPRKQNKTKKKSPHCCVISHITLVSSQPWLTTKHVSYVQHEQILFLLPNVPGHKTGGTLR